MRPTIRLALAGSVLASVAIAGPAFAASSDYPITPTGPATVSSTTVESGNTVTFSGSGFRPNSSVAITVDGQPVTTVMADGGGAFSVSVRLSGSGQHTLTAAGVDAAGRPRSISSVVTVTGSSGTANAPVASTGTGTGTGGLPFTGVELGAIAGIGGALIVGGAGLRIAGRRRRLDSESPA